MKNERHRLPHVGVEARKAQLLLSAVTLGSVIVLLTSGPDVWRSALSRGADPGALVAGLSLALAWLTACRIVLASAALLGALLLDLVTGTGSRASRAAHAVSRRCTPAVLRGAVRLAVGASVAVGPVAGPAAFADPGPSPQAAAVASTGDLPDLDRLARVPVMAVAPKPDHAAASSGPARPLVVHPPVSHVTVVVPHGASAQTVVVQPGDSLWRIAARHLPHGHTDADVARAWPLWYAANRTTIGADPNLIRPGAVLIRPTA